MGDELKFRYKFIFRDGGVKEFVVRLNGATLALKTEKRDSYPEWTKLDFERCANCPLPEEGNEHCPVALGLYDVLDFFKDFLSSADTYLNIEAENRTYLKRTPLSTGVSALIGLVMATAGCPIFDKLKPMVRTHLPFPTLQESMYRFLAMYMLSQYFQAQRGKEPDFKMEGMLKLLDDVRSANKNFCKRLYSVCRKDASLNAIVHLDCFADNTAFFLKKKGLEDVEKTFHAHFENDS